MQGIINFTTSLVLILVILCVQSLSTVSILHEDGDINLIELVELAGETEESNESDEKNLEEDSEDFFITKYIKSNSRLCDLESKSDRFICLYKSLCLDIKGAPPDFS